MEENNKDGFHAYFIHANPLEYLLKETLGGKCLVHHCFMRKIGRCGTSVITATMKYRWYTMITWMMGGRRSGPRPRSTSHNAINTLSEIGQGQVVDLFGPTSMYCTITPTISSLVEIVSGMRPISKSPITTNNISWKSQQSTIFTLVVGKIVVGMRPISNSPFGIKYCLLIAIGIVAGLLWPRSTYIKVSYIIKRVIVAGQNWPTSTTSVITCGIVSGLLRPMSKSFKTYIINWVILDGLKRPMSTTLLLLRQLHTLFFRTFITVVTATGEIMAGLTRPIS